MEYRYTAGQNNGRITQAMDYVTGEEVTYQYDTLNRLIRAETTDNAWGNAYTYDGWGNLTGKSVTKGTAPVMSENYDPGLNMAAGSNPPSYVPPGYGDYFDPEDRPHRGRAEWTVDRNGNAADGLLGYDGSWKKVRWVGRFNCEIYFYGISGQRLARLWCGQEWDELTQQWVAAHGLKDRTQHIGGQLTSDTGKAITTDRLGSVRAKDGERYTYYPNGLSSTFVYDDLNRLKSLNGYSYTLEPTGNRTAATEPNGRSLSWSCDGIYRLTNETISLDSRSKNGTVTYGLDPVGNRMSQTSTLSGIDTGAFTYDTNDRLSTEQYDNDGNTISSGARTFAYDFENRLKSMNNSAVTIAYDGDGNRIAKTVAGVTTRYLVDDLNPTGYAQVIEELAGSAVTRRYTLGLQRISQTQPTNSTWTPSFYGYDGFDSVRTLTDSAGTVTDTYDYDAWGNAINTTGSTPNVHLYRGEQYDPDLRLHYLRARYFNPLSGRFLSQDPRKGEVRVPATQHKYLYSGADPVNRWDPSGRGFVERAFLTGVVVLQLGIPEKTIQYGPSFCKIVNGINTALQVGAAKKKISWENRYGQEIEVDVEPSEGLSLIFEHLNKWCETFF